MKDRSRIERNGTDTNCTNFKEFDRDRSEWRGGDVVDTEQDRTNRGLGREGKGEDRESELSRTYRK
jgi:hypothetical protein